MTDTATLTIRLNKIKQARDTGVLMVRHGDTSTQFRSLEEMDQIIADLEKKLGHKRRRIRYAYQSSKGL